MQPCRGRVTDSSTRIPPSTAARVPLLGFLLAPWLLGAIELVLLPEVATPARAGPVFWALSFVCLAGILAPICGVLALLAGLSVWFERTAETVGSRRRVLGVVVLATLPVTAWISYATFGDPVVRLSRIIAATLALSATLALVVTFVSRRSSHHRFAKLVALAAFAIAFGLVLASRDLFPDLYDAQHVLLGVAASIAAGVSLGELLSGSAVRYWNRKRLSFLAVGMLALSVISNALVPLDARIAWTLFGETTLARYALRPLWTRTDGAGTPLVPPAPTKPHVSPAKPPNIVLFYIDNVQTNHVGAYGYSRRPTTPAIDAFAKQAVVFDRAYTPCPRTRNFMSTLLFGRFVPEFEAHTPPREFRDFAITQELSRRGYRIFVQGFFENWAWHEFDPKDYAIDEFVPPDGIDIDEAALFSRIEAELARDQRENRPLFLWVHLPAPHWTNDGRFRGSPEVDFGKEPTDLYDAAIAGSDRAFSRLRSLVSQHLGTEETIWIVGSDHGAGLERSGGEVSRTLFEDNVHVPLIIGASGFAPRRVSRNVDAALDVSATILDLLGAARPASHEGQSLVPELSGEIRPSRPFVLTVYHHTWIGVLDGNEKLVLRRGTPALFDLERDPGERDNLVDQRLSRARELAALARATAEQRIQVYHRGSRSK
jgi:arylsulfatase A-like enzyme